MKVSQLQPQTRVLAFDRLAHCLREVSAVDTDLIDQFGQRVTDYEDCDTEKGELTRRGVGGALVKEYGFFYVVVKHEVAKRLAERVA